LDLCINTTQRFLSEENEKSITGYKIIFPPIVKYNKPLHNLYLSPNIREDEMSRACSTHRADEKCG
jgi:hypothetical protein